MARHDLSNEFAHDVNDRILSLKPEVGAGVYWFHQSALIHADIWPCSLGCPTSISIWRCDCGFPTRARDRSFGGQVLLVRQYFPGP